MKRADDGHRYGGQPMASTTLRLILPLPPSVNHQYATVNGRRVLSWEAKRYKQKTTEGLKRLAAKGWLEKEALDTLRNSYLALCFDFYFKTSLRRDLDGGLKIAQDAICEAWKINDNRVVQAQLNKRIDPEAPRLEVAITALPSWEFRHEPFEESDSVLTFDLSRWAPRRGRSPKRERTLEELARDLGWDGF